MSFPTRPLLTIPALLLAFAASTSAQSEFWLQFTNATTTSATPIEDTFQVGVLDAEAEVGRGELWARTTTTTSFSSQWTWMSYSIDDFVFSSPGDAPIDVQMNLRLEDLVMTSSAGSPDWVSHVIWIEGIDGAATAQSRWKGSAGAVLNATGVLTDLEFGASEYAFTLGPITVPVNEPVRLGVKFLIESAVQTPNSSVAVGTTAGRVTFDKNGPAFLVPPGVTVNSVESVVVDNIFKPAITARVPQDFPTIQDALSSTGDGSTIEISKGTYFETLDLSGKDDVTLRGKGKVVIDAGFSGSPCLLLEGCENVRIEKLGFAGGTSGVELAGCEGVTISKCRFEEQLGNGLTVRECTGVVVEKCRIDDAAENAIALGESQDVTVIKTRMNLADGSRAVAIGLSNDVLIERCRIVGEGVSDGISFLKASALTFERNKLVNMGGTGIEGFADGLVVERNRIVGASIGIALGSSDNTRLERNKVVKSTLDAFSLADGVGVIVERNKAVKPLGRAFAIAVDDSTFERNVSVGAGAIGFEVTGVGNTFAKNRASKSAQFDLVDETEGANTYAPDNKFKTVQID